MRSVLSNSGESTLSVAKELGVAGGWLRKWIKQVDLDNAARTDGLTSAEPTSCVGCAARNASSSRSARS
jgi:transposase-like protein